MNDIAKIAKHTRSSYREACIKLENAKSTEERFYILGTIAIAAINIGKYKEARQYANELNKLISEYHNNWNYGNAIQDVNVVLGRLAVVDGRIDEAKNHLLEAGKSPGSPQMMSFGPNMSLAKDLLEKGERKVVLEYFGLCKKFWKNDRDILNKWANEIKNGDIPDFGGNLFY